MTPPLFLVAELPADDTVVLDGAEARHAVTVKRLAVGEQVLLADGRGGLVLAVAEEVARDHVRFAVLERREVPERAPRVVVVQALPKGERADLAVEILTELGVDEIVPWSASRSVSQWRGADKIDRGLAKWRRTALEAAKQSRRARIPAVLELVDTAGVQRRLGASGVLGLVLHEDATQSLGASLAALPDAAGEPMVTEVVLVVGPEGGISGEELAAFAATGAHAVRLGPEVLRTSTAGAAALAVLSTALRRWD